MNLIDAANRGYLEDQIRLRNESVCLSRYWMGFSGSGRVGLDAQALQVKLWAQFEHYPPAVSAKQASTARPTLADARQFGVAHSFLAPMTHRPSFSLTTSSITSLSRFGNMPYSVLQMC